MMQNENGSTEKPEGSVGLSSTVMNNYYNTDKEMQQERDKHVQGKGIQNSLLDARI